MSELFPTDDQTIETLAALLKAKDEDEGEGEGKGKSEDEGEDEGEKGGDDQYDAEYMKKNMPRFMRENKAYMKREAGPLFGDVQKAHDNLGMLAESTLASAKGQAVDGVFADGTDMVAGFLAFGDRVAKALEALGGQVRALHKAVDYTESLAHAQGRVILDINAQIEKIAGAPIHKAQGALGAALGGAQDAQGAQDAIVGQMITKAREMGPQGVIAKLMKAATTGADSNAMNAAGTALTAFEQARGNFALLNRFDLQTIQRVLAQT